ncbi:MAG: AmmeMemoRadiSam system protein B [Pseudomonadota bacterium]
MGTTRYPAVAGMFYPDDPAELRAMITEFLQHAAPDGPAPKALIAPHAGYIYSGPIAASAYARLKPVKDTIKKVVLLGPSHRVAFRGLAAPQADEFLTPLGRIRIDQTAIKAILSLPQVHVLDQAHLMEHSLEVHLPFLQMVLRDFALVPLVVGEASAEEVSEVLERLWGNKETLIVVSSDLSHYLSYNAAKSMDRQTSTAIETLDSAAIGHEQACGRTPIIGLLHSARRHHMQVHTIDLRNSGDTSGSKDRVVGYGAYVFE